MNGVAANVTQHVVHISTTHNEQNTHRTLPYLKHIIHNTFEHSHALYRSVYTWSQCRQTDCVNAACSVCVCQIWCACIKSIHDHGIAPWQPPKTIINVILWTGPWFNAELCGYMNNMNNKIHIIHKITHLNIYNRALKFTITTMLS